MNRRMIFAAVAMFVAMPASSAVAQSAAQLDALPHGLTEPALRKQIADWQRHTKQWQDSYIRNLNAKMRRENDPEKKQKIREKIERIRSTAGKVILIPPLNRETSKPGDVGQHVARKTKKNRRTQRWIVVIPRGNGPYDASVTAVQGEAYVVFHETIHWSATNESDKMNTLHRIDVRPYAPEGFRIVNDLDPKTNDLGRSFDERERKQATAEESP